MLSALTTGLTFRGKSKGRGGATTSPSSDASSSAPTGEDTLRRSGVTTRDIFKSSWAVPALGCVCLPRVPEVLSTLALARTTRQLLEGEMPVQSLAVLVGLQLLELGVAPLAQWAVARWRDDATRHFGETLADEMFDNPVLWLEKKPKETEAAMSFGNDTPWAVQESVTNTASGVGMLAGMALHGAMVASTLDARIAINLAVAIGAAGGAGKLVALLQETVTPKPKNRNDQSADAYFKTKRGDFWDNIVLGNRDNALRWAGEYDLAFNDWSARLVRREGLRNLVALGASVACGTFAFYNLTQSVGRLAAEGNSAAFAGVALPMAYRACQTLNSTSELMGWLPAYVGHEAIFARVLRDTNPPATLDLSSRISQGNKTITLTCPQGDPVHVDRHRLDAALALTNEPGLVLVEGPNGTGKSMLITWLKTQLGTRAFMWPAKNQLQFGLPSDSSGGLAMGTLRILGDKLAAYPDTQVLLLDEIDANLDADNCKVAKNIIDELAQKYCVFQITHRNHEQD